MKFTIGATIPTGQYANLQPSIEVEAETFDEAYEKAMPYIEKIWGKYGEKPLTPALTIKTPGKYLKAFVGGEIYFDEVTHTYTNKYGEVYLSGSEYAKKFEKPFDAKVISGLMAKNIGCTPELIQAMWALKSDVSTSFGHAIHGALELHGKYLALSNALDEHRATKKQPAKNTHLHDHPILKSVVESFFKGREAEVAEYEALIVDHTSKHAGTIDRLLITGKNTCRVQDYKTNAVMTKEKMVVYWEQLKFYADILEANGWHVEGLDIFAWNGEWEEYHEAYSKETVK